MSWIVSLVLRYRRLTRKDAMPTLELHDTSLHYELRGEGEPVVLVVGLGGNHRFWEPLLPSWTSGFQCLIFDWRGVGLSSGSDVTEYTTKLLADDVAALMEHVGMRSAHVLGRSMGGCIAQELAIHHRDRTKSLTLASTWARADGMLRAVLDSWTRLLTEGSERIMMEQAVLWGLPRHVFDEQFSHVSRDVFTLANEGVTLPQRPNEFAKLSAAGQNHDAVHDLPTVTAPALVVAGSDDILTPYHLARELYELIPNAELLLMQGAGHALYEQMPAKFAAVARRFWGTVDSAVN
jgi:3-oxoadipate enol-lactonase